MIKEAIINLKERNGSRLVHSRPRRRSRRVSSATRHSFPQRARLLTDLLSHSRQAIKKYVQANNDLSASTENQFTSQFNKALQKGGDSGVFARPKGTLRATITLTHTRCCNCGNRSTSFASSMR